ncbi:MAG TPA: lasso RiPP family leader peptide-containing protein [Chloroflexota bacterium]|nr:lasso RiPP family leader peptide-containing protein [Chloroflexota bacterium]
MYERPKLERFGTFRELTQNTLGLTGGDSFGMFCGDNSVGPPRYSS